MPPNCALFLLVYFLSHMPADCMVRCDYVGWLGEVRMGYDFRFIRITPLFDSM